ncbi:MAG: 16S rRNA (guanine(527)-N(7))-methyltransferase RsmG [Deinococcales bacterium]
MSTQQQTQLERYTQLVRQYSGVLDLSSPKHLQDFEVAIVRCRPFAEAIPENARVLDIGSGAGLPAIPIAILRPDLQITLCEIRSKRAGFLERVVSVLALENTRVHQGDVRSVSGEFDVVTALWLGSLKNIYTLAQPRLAQSFSIITRKGQELDYEWQEMPNWLKLETKPLEQGASLVVMKGTHGSENY